MSRKPKEELSPLTDAERDFAEKNYKLIYAYLVRRRLNPEDWYGICALAYIKAIKLYNPQKGSFSTFAYLVMSSEINHTHRIMNAQKRTKCCAQSLNIPVKQSEDEETFSLLDLISNPADPMTAADTKIALEKILSGLKESDRYIVLAAMHGAPEKDIAAKLGNISRSAISFRLKKARKQIKRQLSEGV